MGIAPWLVTPIRIVKASRRQQRLGQAARLGFEASSLRACANSLGVKGRKFEVEE